MAFSSVRKDTRADGWAVSLPWWLDSHGRPNTWYGTRPSWHGVIFFLGAGTSTRAALNALAPAEPFWYVLAYAACIVAGLAAARAVRARADDAFSRMCSGWLGYIGFTGSSAVAALFVTRTPAEAPPIADEAPVAASALVMLLTVGGSLLTRWFPASRPRSAEQLDAEVRELAQRLADARARRERLGRMSAEPGHDPRTVRTWARSTGLDVPARGPLPEHVVAAWHEARSTTAA
ncbi:hypothetical protein CP966_10080 [Streptomyces galilaeus]|nr:hypothetical protein CP966_10080 [Streptomyces galilaeus]GGW74091.1 hypothetical protein GCM10010350_68530 [Streptomyces galilaeus]